MADTLGPIGGWKWPIIIAFGLLVCLPIDIMIFELASYVWRSIIKGYWKGEHKWSFIAATFLLVAGIVYSMFVSQKGTHSAMAEGAPKEKTINTEEADKVYKQALNLAANNFSQNEAEVDKRFAEQEKAISRKYAVMLDGLQSEYALAEKKYSPTSKRLSQISKKMQAAETAKAEELSTLATAKANEMAGYQSEKLAAEKTATGVWETNVKILTEVGTGSNENKRKLSAVFSFIFSTVAGLAVLFVVALAAFLELFYHRAKIERIVLIENADINGGVIADVIRFPLVWVNRNLAKWIQDKYSALPGAIKPRPMDPVYDPTGMEVPIIAMTTETPPAKEPAKPAAKESKPLAPPPHLADKGFLIPISYTGITPATPPPAAPLGGLESFSLKESKPTKESAKDEAAKSSRGIPDELEDIIKKAFKNPAKLLGFYEVIGFSPADFSTAFDYLERLKKTARNCNVAAKNPKGSDNTRALNSKRLRYITSELCRMSVEVYPADGGIRFRWILDPARREGWEKMV